MPDSYWVATVSSSTSRTCGCGVGYPQMFLLVVARCGNERDVTVIRSIAHRSIRHASTRRRHKVWSDAGRRHLEANHTGSVQSITTRWIVVITSSPGKDTSRLELRMATLVLTRYISPTPAGPVGKWRSSSNPETTAGRRVATRPPRIVGSVAKVFHAIVVSCVSFPVAMSRTQRL